MKETINGKPNKQIIKQAKKYKQQKITHNKK